VITSAVTAGFWHSYVKGLFLSCSAALVPTAGMRHTACVGAHQRAVSDYSGKFPHTQ
jgi:hypothetical protein